MATFQEYEDKVNAKFAEVSGDLTGLSTGLDTVIAGIQALKDQIAQGGSVAKTDLDELDATADAVRAQAAEVKTKVDTAV